MNDAITNGLIDKNPAYKLSMTVPQKEIIMISPKEMTQILDYIEKTRPTLVAYFAIGFFTGARSGEILALKHSDIDLKNNSIRFGATVTVGVRKESTKTNKIRYVEIFPMLKPYLIKHLEHMDTQGLTAELFTHASGEPIVKYRTISNCWRPALKALGISHQSQYSMRHAFASNMLVAQLPDTVIASMLGHSDLSMLHKTYGNKMNRNRMNVGTKFAEYFNESINEK
ncbi:MAG: site-specific integrase [Deferribacteraceae bacterium]|jgi:integrase|nr:site-specific integrase [Deferribacteraceae bacterium]